MKRSTAIRVGRASWRLATKPDRLPSEDRKLNRYMRQLSESSEYKKALAAGPQIGIPDASNVKVTRNVIQRNDYRTAL